MKKLYDVTIYRVLHCPVTPGVNLVSGPLILHKYFNDMQSSIQSPTESGDDPALKSTRSLSWDSHVLNFCLGQQAKNALSAQQRKQERK